MNIQFHETQNCLAGFFKYLPQEAINRMPLLIEILACQNKPTLATAVNSSSAIRVGRRGAIKIRQNKDLSLIG